MPIKTEPKVSTPDRTKFTYNRNFFIENKGQWPSEVLFMTQRNGMAAWITNNGVIYDLYRKILKTDSEIKGMRKSVNCSDEKVNRHVIKISLEGHQPSPEIELTCKQNGYYNYLIGNDKDNWVTDVSLDKEVILKDVYSGIDQKYYFDENNIRYDFIANEGSDVTSIRMKIEGSDKSAINKEGDLVMTTRFGELKQAKLYTYQVVEGKKVKVDSKFCSKPNGDFGFDIGEYDRSKPLIIDPIIWSTYLCGSEYDNVQSMAVNEFGEVYITGGTWSSNFPTFLGYSNTFNVGWADGFVTKFNADGTGLIYSTFLGSVGYDWMKGIDVNKDGYAFVIGETNSLTYPCTLDAYSTSLTGGNPNFHDVVVTVLNAQGNGLVYSSYIGSSDDDFAGAIKVAPNSSNIFYICGQTEYSNFPTTVGALLPFYQGLSDGFICRMDRTILGAGSLTNSTFFGGSNGADFVRGLTLDISNNVYVTGETAATNFPVSSTFGSGFISSNVFVSKVNSSLSVSLYSAIIQGDGIDAGMDIDINANGEAYVSGYAGHSNFYTNTGLGWGGGASDMFIAKLNSTGTICDSKFIGGNGDDKAYGLQLFANKVYITGYSRSSNFPTTPATALSTTLKGTLGDAVIIVLDNNLFIPTPRYGTYLGGSLLDIGYSIYVDLYENIYIAGQTGSSNYPVTSGAFQSISGGIFDGFVTKLNPKCGNIANSTYYLNPKSSIDFPSGNLPTTPVIIDGNFWVDQNTNIVNNPNIFFTPNAMVVVDPNVDFTINTSELKACNDMWDGIYENGNSQVVNISNSVLNDMINGVNSYWTSKINCTNSTFNNNYRSFSLKKMSTASNCIIQGNTIQQVGTGLKAPYLGQKPYYGMYIEDCFNINIGTMSNANSSNMFKDMRCGIRLAYTTLYTPPNSSINLYNNQFKNINEPSINLNSNGILGCAIYANNALSVKSITLNVEGHQFATFNHFDNCDKGIILSRVNGMVKFNKMFNTVLGVFMLNCTGRNYNIRNNTMLNTQLGICKNGDEGTIGTKISGNTITLSTFSNVFGSPTATGIKSRYSSITHVGKTFIDGSVAPNVINVPMSVNGIAVSLENGMNDIISENQVHLLTTTGSTITAIPNLIGIYSNNNDSVSVLNNLIDNNFSITSNTSFVPGNNAGIYINNNTNSLLQCNAMDYLKWGIFATRKNGSYSNYQRTVKNRMRASSADMMLWELGVAGTLGVIGKDISSIPLNRFDANNEFLGNPSLNRVFRFNPSGTCKPIAYAEGITTMNSKLTQSQSTAWIGAVGSQQCRYEVQNPRNFSNVFSCGTNLVSISNIDIDIADAIANDEIEYDEEFEEGARRADEEMLYAWLDANAQARNDYPILDSFYLSLHSNIIGVLHNIDRNIAILSDEDLLSDEILWNAALQGYPSHQPHIVQT